VFLFVYAFDDESIVPYKQELLSVTFHCWLCITKNSGLVKELLLQQTQQVL